MMMMWHAVTAVASLHHCMHVYVVSACDYVYMADMCVCQPTHDRQFTTRCTPALPPSPPHTLPSEMQHLLPHPLQAHYAQPEVQAAFLFAAGSPDVEVCCGASQPIA